MTAGLPNRAFNQHAGRSLPQQLPVFVLPPRLLRLRLPELARPFGIAV